MVCAVIDVGSNTIRMSVYKIENGRFSVLFSKKETAGLANYIMLRQMSPEGVNEAVDVLNSFKSVLKYIAVDELHVFATASLRNIDNSLGVLEAVKRGTGFDIEIISGEEEAELGFAGASCQAPFSSGYLFDVGGGSAEIVSFENMKPDFTTSIEIGSLNLYKNNVEKIWPKKKEMESINKRIDDVLTGLPDVRKPALIGVGGTARSLRDLINSRMGYPAANKTVTMEELEGIAEFLQGKSREALDAVLKKCPDRIHTIIPGTMLINGLAKRFGSEKLYISDYGVREGYLWKNIMMNLI